MKKNIYFFFRAYNDIDHTTPLIYLLKKKRPDLNIILCTFLNRFELNDNNHNLKFLKKQLSLKIKYLNNENKNLGYFLNWLSFKIKLFDGKSKIIFMIISIIQLYIKKLSTKFNEKEINKNLKIVLNKYKPSYFFADYIYPNDKPFKYVNNYRIKKNIKLIQLPHGVDVFLRNATGKKKIQFHKNYINKLEKEGRYYDFVISNSENSFTNSRKIGVKKDKIFNLGSLRFEKSWLKNLNKIDNKNKNLQANNKRIILILLNKLMYKGSKLNIRKIIIEASKYGTVMIKPHTRNMKISFIKDLLKNNKIILVDSYNTSYLIMISKIVVFWGTSMGMHAILQKKKVIYAKFAHKLSTVYDSTLKKYTAKNISEFKKLIDYHLNKNIKYNKGLIKTLERKFSNGGTNTNSKKLYLDFFDRYIK